MLVTEFLEQMENPPLSSDAPDYYMGLFLTMLDEFRDERCSVLLGKIKERREPVCVVELRLEISRVGQLVEHADGRIDLSNWIADGDLDNLDLVVKVFKKELIAVAKEAGTYTFCGE